MSVFINESQERYRCGTCRAVHAEWVPVCPRCKSGRLYVVVDGKDREPKQAKKLRKYGRTEG